jgi:hypothetical protein
VRTPPQKILSWAPPSLPYLPIIPARSQPTDATRESSSFSRIVVLPPELRPRASPTPPPPASTTTRGRRRPRRRAAAHQTPLPLNPALPNLSRYLPPPLTRPSRRLRRRIRTPGAQRHRIGLHQPPRTSSSPLQSTLPNQPPPPPRTRRHPAVGRPTHNPPELEKKHDFRCYFLMHFSLCSPLPLL